MEYPVDLIRPKNCHEVFAIQSPHDYAQRISFPRNRGRDMFDGVPLYCHYSTAMHEDREFLGRTTDRPVVHELR